MSRWIDLPNPPLIHSRAAPLLVENSRLDELAVHYAEAHRADVPVAEAASSTDVIDGLKAELAFPDWCGSSWDSIDDAYQELRDAWPFPLLLVLRDFDVLLERHQQVALATVINIHDLQRGLSVDERQLIVAYAGERWA